MPFVQGFLRIRERGHPGHGLPDEEGPIDPGYGVDAPTLPDQGLPRPPPGVWPPPTVSHPIVPAPPGTPPGTIWPSPGLPPHPSHGLPGAPAHPSHPLPPAPVRPGQGLPTPPATPGTPLPPVPGAPDQGLPPAEGTPTPPIASKVFWMLAYCPSLGWNFVAVDPSLSVSAPIAPAPAPKA